MFIGIALLQLLCKPATIPYLYVQYVLNTHTYTTSYLYIIIDHNIYT